MSAISALDAAPLSGLFGDADTAALIGAPAAVAAMLRFEGALAKAQGAAGMIPADAAARIAAVADGLRPDLQALAAPTALAGIAAQPVIAALKQAAGADGAFVHFGATSQDVVDTGLALQLKAVLALFQQRLQGLDATLATKARDYADQPIAARTRFQIAAPTTLGAKIAVWRAPLVRHLDRLTELMPRLLLVSLYGAAGTGAAFAGQGAMLRQAMAADLGLNATDVPWHATRDGIAELAGWLSLVTGSLGKMGADLILLAQSEIAELRAGTGGGSSTMPQKSNPVAAETLVALARVNAGAVGTLHQALVHAQERDGTALGIEWQVLPDMVVRAGAALRIAADLAATLTPNTAQIDATFAADRGLMLSEAATFALARIMPRPQAQQIVARAITQAVASGETLAEVLTRESAGGIDWRSQLALTACLGDAPQVAQQSQS